MWLRKGAQLALVKLHGGIYTQQPGSSGLLLT